MNKSKLKKITPQMVGYSPCTLSAGFSIVKIFLYYYDLQHGMLDFNIADTYCKY